MLMGYSLVVKLFYANEQTKPTHITSTWHTKMEYMAGMYPKSGKNHGYGYIDGLYMVAMSAFACKLSSIMVRKKIKQKDPVVYSN